MKEHFEHFIYWCDWCDAILIFLDRKKTDIALIALTIILFFAYNSHIVNFINRFLLVDNDFSNVFVDGLIIFFAALLLIIVGIKILRHRYIISFFQFAAGGGLIAAFGYFYYTEKLYFLKDSICGFYYVGYFIIPLLLFLLGSFLSFLISHFCYKNNTHDNILNDDSPKSTLNEDELGYEKIVNKLSKILVNDKHKKSFTIGLVGPWGNGKSSIIEFLINNLKSKAFKQDKKDLITEDYIIIKFQPYLNHNEKDIITDFFESFNAELSKFNGKISNSILEYSKKITDLYDKTNISTFLDGFLSKNLPANKYYETINNCLKEIHKKVIVFVDDLDRLNETEISQVLKLIRNTADFRNTTFVVAMDKAYVLSRLKKTEKILDARFVDKFFQMEVYLPKIDVKILQKAFIKQISDSKEFAYLKSIVFDINTEVEKYFNTEDKNLFHHYISNLRDVKRLANQIVYDYPLIEDNIDFSDFINFTLLKLRFPRIIDILRQQPERLLKFKPSKNLFYLEEKKIQQEDGKEISAKDIFFPDIDDLLQNTDIIDVAAYKNIYAVYDLLINSKDYDVNNRGYFDKALILKTLVTLFGGTEVKTSESIQHKDTFNMLLGQKVNNNILRPIEFISILESSDDYRAGAKYIINENKLEYFFKRLEYFETKNANEYKNLIMILLYIMEEDKMANDNSCWGKINILVQKLLETDRKNKYEAITQWIKENIFDNQNLKLENKIEILAEVYNSNNRWKLKETYLNSKAEEYFTAYINTIENKRWEVNDFSFYKVFHALKFESFQPTLAELYKGFWNESNVELLFAQSLRPFAGLDYNVLNLYEFDKFVFKDIEALASFIESKLGNINDTKAEIQEFISLLRYMRFQRYIKFNFQASELAKQRIQELKKMPHSREETHQQIIFEINNQDLAEHFKQSRVQNSMPYYELYWHEKKYYLLYTIEQDMSPNSLIQDMYHMLQNTEAFSDATITNNSNKGDVVIKCTAGDIKNIFMSD